MSDNPNRLGKVIEWARRRRRTTELRPAHTWTCDDCGRDNFCRGAVPAEMDAEERAEMEAAGLPALTEYWLTAPASVKCSACGAEFDVKEYVPGISE